MKIQMYWKLSVLVQLSIKAVFSQYNQATKTIHVQYTLIITAILLLLLLLNRVCIPTSENSQASVLNLESGGIIVNVKIMSLQTTLKTVFGGSRTDMFGKRVPDERKIQTFVLVLSTV